MDSLVVDTTTTFRLLDYTYTGQVSVTSPLVSKKPECQSIRTLVSNRMVKMSLTLEQSYGSCAV